MILAVAAVAGLIGLAMIPNLRRDRAEAIAEARAWAIDGPACPQLALAEAAAWPYQPRKDFDYAGANFGFMFGHVACAEVHDDGGTAVFRGYPVCQFTSPAVVSVRVGGANFFFAPGLSRRATVTVQDGAARCVMAGRFYGQNDF